jgi:putative oxidoreductase
MNELLTSKPLIPEKGLAVIRIFVGLLMVYHGKEVFDQKLMQGYMDWDMFQNKTGTFLVYMGKSSELVAGILLTLGLLTRLGSAMLVGTMLYITFFVGHGRFWYEDQHPFMFVLFGVLFFFLGPGSWSLDRAIWKGQ